MKKQQDLEPIPVPRFRGDAIKLCAYASHDKARGMTKLCEIDVTGGIGQKLYGSNEKSKGGGDLFTILDNLYALNPDCAIKVTVEII